MSGKTLVRLSVVSLALILASCGGDESSSPLAGSGNSGGSGGSTTDTGSATVEVGSIELIANPLRLDTTANAQSSITARVKDSNGVLLEGVPVIFNASNGGTLAVSQSETDQAGLITATLSTAGSPRNRIVTVSAESGNFSDSVEISIGGTGIAIAGPSSVALGSTSAFRITLADADGNGIANETVNLTTSLGTLSASTLATNSNGVVDVQLNSGSTGGTATITASAYSGSSTVSATQDVAIASDSFGFTSPSSGAEINLNTPQEISIEWLTNGNPVADGSPIQFTTTRGTLTPASGSVTTAGGNATIEISSANAGIATITASDPNSGLSADLAFEFVATTPDSINLQATKTQLDLEESSEIIAIIRDADNNLVKNQEVSFTLSEDSSGGRLASSRGVTDSQGRASTIYQAGTNTSGRDGVVIEANVGAVSDTVNLTVARQALRLAVGTGNEISEPDSVRYTKDYVAIVTDANGAPVENANIELSVLPTGYIKGQYADVDGSWEISPSDPVFCDAEDVNRNGQLDAGEDINGSLSLEPTNSATTSAATVASSSDGSASFSLLYPQSHCNWVRVELTATVKVGGSESVESSEFFLACAASDLNDTDITPPGGVEGLYGVTQDCTVEN